MQARRVLFVLLASLVLCFLPASLSIAAELDLSFEQVDYAQIFKVLGESQGLNVLIDPEVTGQGSFQLKGVSFSEALQLISSYSGYAYRLAGNTLLVASPQRLQELEHQEIRYVQTARVTPGEVLDALSLILPRESVYVAPEGGLVVLHGSQALLDQAEELIGRLDSAKAAPANVEQGRSLLEVFKELSAELEVNLIADPALEEKRLVVDLRSGSPLEIVEHIKKIVPLKVELTEHTLMVGILGADAAEQLKVYRLNYAEPAAAKTALGLLLPEARIQLDADRKSIVVRGTDLELAEVDLFLVDFDRPAPQVVLEVWVQEMSSEALRNLGVDWQGVPSFTESTAPVFLELEWDAWDLILALRILEEKGDAKLLANPKITTLSGQAASIFVGDRVPVVLTDDEGHNTLEFLESGINLRVTPRISEDEYITILVEPEVSTFIWRADTDYPQIRTREAQTTVRVRNGQPFVLGGLLQEQENESIKRIPFLSQLPVLGKLFQWKETKQNQTEMTIFLIPRIVEEGEGVEYKDFFTTAQ
ncbi:MAG: type II secretion system protein GspD [Firmicutes bacterium]|nr:type II secretion system protein GspD [Bacillota bacterium]